MRRVSIFITVAFAAVFIASINTIAEEPEYENPEIDLKFNLKEENEALSPQNKLPGEPEATKTIIAQSDDWIFFESGRETVAVGTWTSEPVEFDISISITSFDIWWESMESNNNDDCYWTIAIQHNEQEVSNDESDCTHGGGEVAKGTHSLSTSIDLVAGDTIGIDLSLTSWEDVKIYFDNVTYDSGLGITGSHLYLFNGIWKGSMVSIEFAEAWPADWETNLDGGYVMVMGDEGSERPSTPNEMKAMVGLLRDAMDAGAIGLATSSNENHRGDGGIPIASRLATDDEFRGLVEVLQDYDHGVFMATFGERHSIPFLEDLCKISGKPGFYAAHFHYAHQPDRATNIMNMAADARRRGIPVYTQGSCQPLSLTTTLDKAYVLKAMHPWPSTEDHNELRIIFSDPTFRKSFRETLGKSDSQHIFKGRWDWVPIAVAGLEANQHLVGKTIAEIAQERGEDPLDTFLNIGLEENFATKFSFYILNMMEDGVAEIIQNDGTLISLSDAGAHNALLCDAGYAMHLLGHWVRDKSLFDLPTGIRKVTSDPAEVYGIIDRGRLTPGAWADMILFDPDKIGITNMRRHFDLPAGGERLLRKAPGLHGTWVNGVQIFDGKNYLDVTAPGHVLTKFDGSLPRLGMDLAVAAE